MKVYLYILFAVFFSLSVYSQDLKQGLIVVHVDVNSKAEFKQKIYSYHFLNGSFTGREELLTVAGKKDGKDYIRTDIGLNMLYKDRYLITGIGNIVDLKDKKILFDGRAALVKCSNDSAIYYTNDAFKGKYYSVYNFKTNQYAEVKNLLFKPKAGQDVEFDKTTSPFKLNLYPPNKPKIELVKDAGYGQSGMAGGKVPDPVMWWVDNTNFVYAYFNKENTEVSFFKVNTDSKSSTLIGKVAIKPESKAADILRMDNKQVIMLLGAKQIFVDAGANIVTDLLFSKPSDGFACECKTNTYGHIVKLNDAEVGKFHFQLKNFKTEKNIAALVQELTMGEESYQQGMRVWNSPKQKWDKVDSEDILTLAGWINE
jgi:hypothetical protein